MEPGIQFGELEQTPPEVRLRPDCNRHFAVTAVNALRERDLPIFVDLDVMRDMEDHALSDTSVELGGVMLGGQYEDQDGRPFVMVTDSLRAEHYESTKGSFKFTHDTWERITRERDLFPQDMQMVGWYHTHPDWGVFLSGMDKFICDNFFNKPLDVALVIDPSRQDRGFFQWTGDGKQRVRQTGGFYLTASRFREHELNDYATYLEGKFEMSGDPRVRGPYPAPIINVAGQRQTWHDIAVLGLLAVQFCFLVLIAWRMMSPPAAQTPEGTQQQLALLKRSTEALSEARRRDAETETKIEVLDQVMGRLDGAKQQGLVRSLAERTSEVEELRASVRGHQALEKQLDDQLAGLQAELESAELFGKRVGEERDDLRNDVSNLKSRNKLQREKIATLEEKLASYESPPDDGETSPDDVETWHWAWIVLGAALVALVLGGCTAALLRGKKNRSDLEESSEECLE
jgi:proteasome lid subunit RPN8/RPN11